MTPSMFLLRSDLVQSSRSLWIAASWLFLVPSTAIVSSFLSPVLNRTFSWGLALQSSGWRGLKPQDVDSSSENEKQASLTRLHSHAQNDLVVAILLRYVSF